MTALVNTYPAAVQLQDRASVYFRLGDQFSYEQEVLMGAPGAYWRFSDAGGYSAQDWSAGGAHGITWPTPAGPNPPPSAPGVSFGVVPSALANNTAGVGLTGAQNRGTVASAITTGIDCSFEFWLKVPSSTALQPILAQFGQPSPTGLHYDGAVRKISLITSGGTFKNTTALTVGTLYYVVVTVVGGSVSFYINNTADGGPTGGATSFSADCVFNSGTVGTSPLVTSLIDELAFYARQLSATEIAAHYTQSTYNFSSVQTPVYVDSSIYATGLTLQIAGVVLQTSGWLPDNAAAANFTGESVGGAGPYLFGPASAQMDPDAANRITIEFAAIMPSGDYQIITKLDATAIHGYTVQHTGASNKIRFIAHKATDGGLIVDISSTHAFNDSNFHHVVIAFDGSITRTVTMYVDGAQEATAALSGNTRIDSAGNPFWIGSTQGGAGAPAGLKVADVAVYKFAFSAALVTQHYAARLTKASTKSLKEARSGIARAGAVRAGYYLQRPFLLLNGANRSQNLDTGTLRVIDRQNDQADTATFDVTGIDLVEGSQVIIASGLSNLRVFGGRVMRTTQKSVRANATKQWSAVCTDWTYDLAKHTVTKRYAAGQAAHVVFLDLIATFAPAGFTTKNVKTNSPTLTGDLVFIGTNLLVALAQVKDAASAAAGVPWYLNVDPYQDLHFFDVEATALPKPIVVGNFTYDQLEIDKVITEISTRLLVAGGGSTTTSATAVGATSIAVDDCAWYAATGGTLVTPYADLVTYTGRSAASGPGNITGIPASGAGSITTAIKERDRVSLWVSVDDTAGQNALKVLLGGNDDGIREKFISVTDGTIAMCSQAASAEFARYGLTNISGRIWSRDAAMAAGKPLSINLPGRNQVLTVPLQEVTRRPLGSVGWQFDGTFAVNWRTLAQVLQTVVTS
jgi:hypothetical protein